MQRPLVSVIVPALNAGAHLDTSIESALAQTFSSRAVIVVDDGSTDDTAERLRAWTDSSVQVIRQPNRGVSSAVNAGIAASNSEYVGFLDADDVWLPHKLERHIQFLKENPSVDATFSWVQVIDERGCRVRIPSPRWKGPVSFRQLFADYMIRTMSSVVMRRSAIEEAGLMDPGFVRCMDIEFFLRVALLRPNNIHAIPEVLTLYRRHPGQHTRDWRPVREGWDQVVESIRHRAPEETAAVAELASSNMNRYFASIAYENGHFREVRSIAGRSLFSNPGLFLQDFRNWEMGAACLATLLLPRRALFTLEERLGFYRSNR